VVGDEDVGSFLQEDFFEDGRDWNSCHFICSSLCMSSDKSGVKQANSSDHRHTFLQCSQRVIEIFDGRLSRIASET